MNQILPAMVLRNMRYSKLEISRRCHFCVMLLLRINCLGDIIEARLKTKEIQSKSSLSKGFESSACCIFQGKR